MCSQYDSNSAFPCLFFDLGKILIVYLGFSIIFNHVLGNNFFNVNSMPYPFDITLGIPPFYHFFLAGHPCELFRGGTKYAFANMMIVCALLYLFYRFKIQTKILNILLGLSLLIISIYVIPFLFCYYTS